ncbi:hypothetical protein SBA3_1390014 [Candidatus Sulfopaludibacter sp. SbA3]|nr:hypothetical protein SBA3_1390014 [Candidatus Sulfopaludibacter sp. SbA3]
MLQTLKVLVQEAYSMEDWQVEGPNWITAELYDVAATMPPHTSRETARLMLRTMLAERVGLQVHVAQRDIPVYALVPAKKGFKLHQVTDKPTAYSEMYEDKFIATGTLEDLATYSRRYSDRPVLDMTGIAGVYHIELHWTPDREAPMRRDSGRRWSLMRV